MVREPNKGLEIIMNFLTIAWWLFWGMFWAVIVLLWLYVSGCATTNWETNMMQEASASCPDGLDRLKAQVGRGFELDCERR